MTTFKPMEEKYVLFNSNNICTKILEFYFCSLSNGFSFWGYRYYEQICYTSFSFLFVLNLSEPSIYVYFLKLNGMIDNLVVEFLTL